MYLSFNMYIISSKIGKLIPYMLIYSIKLLELENFKTYIKIYLGHRFIRPSKSLIKAFILFFKKLSSSFRLYIEYQSLNNLIIKN